jgi:hypothetical protein
MTGAAIAFDGHTEGGFGYCGQHNAAERAGDDAIAVKLSLDDLT